MTAPARRLSPPRLFAHAASSPYPCSSIASSSSIELGSVSGPSEHRFTAASPHPVQPGVSSPEFLPALGPPAPQSLAPASSSAAIASPGPSASAQSAQHAVAAASPPTSAAAPSLASLIPHFFDSILHHHQRPELMAEDADLPDYDAPAVAPLWAAVKGGIKAAAPFALLNYLLLLTIL
jgi:hypothetical protein